MAKTPPIGSIIWTDFPALAYTLVIPIAPVTTALFLILTSDAFALLPYYYAANVAMITLSGIGLWSRVARYEQLFETSAQAAGVLTNINIVRDRGRIDFQFEHGGKDVLSWAAVHKNKHVLSLYPGQAVTVLCDPDNPRNATFVELFFTS